MILGSLSRPGAVPAFMKPFLQFPMESPAHPASLGLTHPTFHSFSAMDPVQKAVLSHTFGPPMVKTKRPIISCNVCQIRFNSESQAEAHYKGNRHARRIKGFETSKTRPPEGDKPPPTSPTPPGLSPSSPPEPDLSKQDEAHPCPMSETPAAPTPLLTSSPSPADALLLPVTPPLSTPRCPSPPLAPGLGGLRVERPLDSPSPGPSPSPGESEEDKAKKLLYCALCKVAVNSLSQLEAHNKGTKHKTILEARSGLGPIKAYPRLGPSPGLEQGGGTSSDPHTQERTFHCEICNVRVNSELQLKQHISSRRHRDGVAGKPNPLLSRHKKRTDFLSSLNFPKELPKTMGAGLLPSPLAIAAAMAAAAASSNQLALRAHGPMHHPHHHPLLLQGPPLSLLRPAPGPMRTTHEPILFAPY